MCERDRFMRPVQVEAVSKRIGVAEGKFDVSDDFDDCNNEIKKVNSRYYNAFFLRRWRPIMALI